MNYYYYGERYKNVEKEMKCKNIEDTKKIIRNSLSFQEFLTTNPELYKKVKNYSLSIKEDPEMIFNILQDPLNPLIEKMLFSLFAKRPSRQNIAEKIQKEIILEHFKENFEYKDKQDGNKWYFLHKSSFITLSFFPPRKQKGLNPLYLDDNSNITHTKPNNSKGIDAIVRIDSKTLFLTLKGTQNDGGHQDNVRTEVINFLTRATKNTNTDFIFGAVLDGNYWLQDNNLSKLPVPNNKIFHCKAEELTDEILQTYL